jgi:hypothetical protein
MASQYPVVWTYYSPKRKIIDQPCATTEARARELARERGVIDAIIFKASIYQCSDSQLLNLQM